MKLWLAYCYFPIS